MRSTKSSESRNSQAGSRRRARVSRERREAILDEFDRSGLSGAAFARRHDIKYPTFASWLLKRRKHSTSSENSMLAATGFAEVFLDQSKPLPVRQPPETLQVHLPGGAWLHLNGDTTQSQLAAQFLQALQA